MDISYHVTSEGGNADDVTRASSSSSRKKRSNDVDSVISAVSADIRTNQFYLSARRMLEQFVQLCRLNITLHRSVLLCSRDNPLWHRMKFSVSVVRFSKFADKRGMVAV